MCAIHQHTNPEFGYHDTPNNTRKRRVQLHQQRAAEMRNYYRLATIVKEACKYDLNSYSEQVATQLANTAQNGITKPTYNKIKFFRTRRVKPVQIVRDKQGNVPQDKTEEASNIIGHFATTMKAAPATMKQHVLTDRTAAHAPQSNCPRTQLSGYLTPRRPLQRQRRSKHQDPTCLPMSFIAFLRSRLLCCMILWRSNHALHLSCQFNGEEETFTHC